jgi:hypothetical protein
MSVSWEIGGVYSFDTFAPALLGASFKRVRLSSIMDYEDAQQKVSVDAKHSAVYSQLPTGTPKDPAKLTYLAFTTESAIAKIIMAVAWIDAATVDKVTSQRLVVSIENITQPDITRVRESMVLLGFTDFNIVIE